MVQLRFSRRCRSAQTGFGLVAAVAMLSIASISVGLIAPAVYQVIVADQSAATAGDLEALRAALAGNSALVSNGARADFGFLGTMGAFPAQLSALWLRQAQPAYAFDIARKMGTGWAGPYVTGSFDSDLTVLDRDRFGNAYVLTTTPFTRSDGQVVVARIQSAGADGILNTSDDQTADVLKAETFARVTGTLRNDASGDSPVASATVALNYPLNGGFAQTFDITDSNGVFEFIDVPFGIRSLSVAPKLTYAQGSATVQGNDTLRFTIRNHSTNAITLTSLTASHNVAGFYQRILVGGTVVFNYANPPYNGTRAASGQTINFSSSVNINGSGNPAQTAQVRVQKETTITPDVFIDGQGPAVIVELEDFRSTQTGSGSNVNPSGATFTVTFSDGSQASFTAP